MNIAMVSEHASPLCAIGGVDAGGQNVHVAELAAAMERAGHTVTVYTRRDDERMRRRVRMLPGVVVEHIDAGPPVPLPKDGLFEHMSEFGDRLHAALQRDMPDLVHAHFWMSGYASLRAAVPLGIPVVQTFHALGSEKRRFQGASDTSPGERIEIEAIIARLVERVVATSSSEIFELCRLGADPRRLKMVPCGVNLGFFDSSRAEFALPRRKKYRLVSLSRLVERKGIGDMIAALPLIPDAELVIAGGGEASRIEHDPEATRLRKLAAQHYVADRVTFVGRLERTKVPGFLRSADLVLCTPWYEPFGIVPLEAMASQVPVVASAVGGLNDTISDGITGVHVPPRSPTAIARAVRELLENPQGRAMMGRFAREHVAARYTWERVADETLDVYRGMETLQTAEHQSA
jgi:D-inositol-3-phosphate glycosyltransferase